MSRWIHGKCSGGHVTGTGYKSYSYSAWLYLKPASSFQTLPYEKPKYMSEPISRVSGKRHILSKLLILFAFSSTVSAIGIFCSYYTYRRLFATFAARLGVRTLGYHLAVLLLRWRDARVLEHGLNILALVALSSVWFGGTVWSLYFGADIWGYKLCAGCWSWRLLGPYGGLVAAAEGVALATCAALCMKNRATGSENRSMSDA
jgi:hypothetical protein